MPAALFYNLLPSNKMECFNNIIGLTRTECECFEDAFNEDAKISDSGLYLDEASERFSINAFNAIAGCDGDLQDILDKSRNDGITEFIYRLSQEIGSIYRPKIPSYQGKVGDNKFNSDLTIASGHGINALMIEMKDFNGASVTVNAITPYFNFSVVNLEIDVYKAKKKENALEDVELITTLDLTSTSGTHSKISIPNISLETGRNVVYLFTYTLSNPSNLPKNNSNRCGCGATEANLHKFLHPYALFGDDVYSLDPTKKKPYINGLLLHINAQCSIEDMVCENYSTNPLVRISIAHAIWYLAGSKLITRLLKSDKINRYTMMDREAMQHDAWGLQKKAETSLKWLATNMKVSTDCFICDSNGGLVRKSGIFL